MNFLGLVAHTMGYGDSGAALSVDGHIVGLIEEERFSRKRYDDSFPKKSISHLLKIGGISGQDIRIVTFHLLSWRGLGTRIYWAARHPISVASNSGEYFRCASKLRHMKGEIQEALGHKQFNVECYRHHLCHAAASFYPSTFETSAYMTLDGSGEAITGSIGVASRKKGFKSLQNIHYPHSLGCAYAAVSDYIGFPPPAGPARVMGLAGYGDPKRFRNLVDKLIKWEAGQYKLDLSYFEYHKNLATPLSNKPWMSEKFAMASGVPCRGRNDDIKQEHMDLAASIQEKTNQIGVLQAEWVKRQTGEKNLCIGGGVALNSVMNGVIEKKGIFDHVYIQPAAGDAGNALGSIYLAALAHGEEIPELKRMPFSGPEYSDAEIETELEKHPVSYVRSKNVALDAARFVKDGLVIGWFQGRMEWGPRALGSRSILADPQRKEMHDHINKKVKLREWFRPLAPSVTREAYGKYFTGSPDNTFMLKVSHVKDPYKEVFPAITHVDGTTRVQSVDRDRNPLYHKLLDYLGTIHKHPVVLNTSFNRQAPIVCTPREAVACFFSAPIERLCIGNFVVEKT